MNLIFSLFQTVKRYIRQENPVQTRKKYSSSNWRISKHLQIDSRYGKLLWGNSPSHLFCTLISENQGLEKLRSILNHQIYTISLKKSRWQTEKNLRCTENNSVLQDLKFFSGLKQTLISQDLDFQKSRCRLNGCELGQGLYRSVSYDFGGNCVGLV